MIKQIESNINSAYNAWQGGYITYEQYISNVMLNIEMLPSDPNGKKASNDILGSTSIPFSGTGTDNVINWIGDELYNFFFYNDWEERVANNYKVNSSIFKDFDLSKYICDQSMDTKTPAAWDARMGVNKGYQNGCGWISIYNALVAMGDSHHPADIIKWLEENDGLLAGGRLGANPLSMRDYLREESYTAVWCLDKYDSNIKSGDVAILTYAHSSGAHYIATQWNSSQFEAWNVWSGDTAAWLFDSLEDDLLKANGFTGLGVVVIRKK